MSKVKTSPFVASDYLTVEDALDLANELAAKLERAKEGLEDAVAFMKGDISGEAQRLGIIAECEQALKDMEND